MNARKKQALTGIDRSRTAFTPISTEVPTEANQPPQDGKRVELSSSAGKTGEIRPLAENTHPVIDFQKAWENRLVDDPATGAIPETHTFTPHEVKPRLIDAKDIVFHDSAYNELHNGAFAIPVCRLQCETGDGHFGLFAWEVFCDQGSSPKIERLLLILMY